MADSKLPPFAQPISCSTDIPRVLSRPLSSSAGGDEHTYFQSSAENFKPLPYAPGQKVSSSNKSVPPPRNSQRTASSQAPLPMDPSPDDPRVTFLHPPFSELPKDLYPDGLTYAVMEEHQDWFLDANDYQMLKDVNPDGFAYPASLEPPRGWNSKKKDANGVEEENRLRCNFCRKSYAGANGKSMWRRHVLEKHKVGMSNRRDNGVGPRGRGSSKESSRPAPNKNNVNEMPVLAATSSASPTAITPINESARKDTPSPHTPPLSPSALYYSSDEPSPSFQPIQPLSPYNPNFPCTVKRWGLAGPIALREDVMLSSAAANKRKSDDPTVAQFDTPEDQPRLSRPSPRALLPGAPSPFSFRHSFRSNSFDSGDWLAKSLNDNEFNPLAISPDHLSRQIVPLSPLTTESPVIRSKVSDHTLALLEPIKLRETLAKFNSSLDAADDENTFITPPAKRRRTIHPSSHTISPLT